MEKHNMHMREVNYTLVPELIPQSNIQYHESMLNALDAIPDGLVKDYYMMLNFALYRFCGRYGKVDYTTFGRTLQREEEYDGATDYESALESMEGLERSLDTVEVSLYDFLNEHLDAYVIGVFCAILSPPYQLDDVLEHQELVPHLDLMQFVDYAHLIIACKYNQVF